MITKHDIKLIINPQDDMLRGDPPTCNKCGKEPRKLLKSNKYDPYCVKCRSTVNRKYRDKQRENRIRT